MAENQYGKVSCLDVELVCKDGRTALGRVQFTAPFKVMKPFYIDRHGQELMQLMLISVSAGIMAGDTQKLSVRAGDDTFTEINSQSYEKIHRMPEGEAVRHIDISIGRHSFCYYNPLPVIPFAGSAFVSGTDIHLTDDSSVLIYREILSGGRSASGEVFAYRRYENKVRIWQQERLCYYDNTVFEPEFMEMTGFGMMEGYTHVGNMIFCNHRFSEELIKEIRMELEAAGNCREGSGGISGGSSEGSSRDISGGISSMDGGVIVLRIFGMRADDIIRYFDRIYDRIKIMSSFMNQEVKNSLDS